MARSVDWSEIPDSTLLPEDLYTMEVEDITEETSKKGKLMFRSTFRVIEPKLFAGTPLYEYFVVGSDDDLQATEAETWKNAVGIRRLKRLFKSTLVPFSADIDGMIDAVKQQRFVAAVGQEVDDGQADPKYKGVKRNRITAMYPIGTAVPGSASQPAPSAAPGAPAKRTNAAAPTSTKAATPQTVTCPFCATAIARATYAVHIREQHPEEA